MNSELTMDEPVAPRKTRLEESWHLLKQNRLAFVGLIIFILFFCTALIGVVLTSGQDPVFDPSLVRLQEKLRAPLSEPNLETLRPDEVPPFGLYLFGTDDLGRDVFSRMLQGAWVSLTVGFVAVGISVLVGILLGGIAGYFGQNHICLDHILMALLFVFGGCVAFDRSYASRHVARGHWSCLYFLLHRGKKKFENGEFAMVVRPSHKGAIG